MESNDFCTIDQKLLIKEQIIQNLESYGVFWDRDNHKILVNDPNDFREVQRKLSEQTNLKGQEYKDKVQKYLAEPSDINISKIDPYLVLVEPIIEHQRLWAYAISHWSIPVTNGYGRRIRYFVFDSQNDKLIGIIGLCDPVIGLGVRDENSINWTKNQKLKRLYNCMTAYILGAIPPYNQVLASKLVALAVMFPTVRQDFYRKYKNKSSLITGENKKSDLVYIDTLGAFGKSAVYNRLINWEFVDYTKGQSHLHITANGSWELIKQVVPPEFFETYKFGKGPNWKMRILKMGLRELGLSEDMLSIGWQRAYYRCPLAENWKEYLLGETSSVVWRKFTQKDLVTYWHQKWVTPRMDALQSRLHGGLI